MCVCEREKEGETGGSSHTHRSQAETRRTRRFDPYWASPEHRARPLPEIHPAITAAERRVNPACSRCRVSSCRRGGQKVSERGSLSRWKTSLTDWLTDWVATTSLLPLPPLLPPPASRAAEECLSFLRQIKRRCWGRKVAGSDTLLRHQITQWPGPEHIMGREGV